MKKLIILTFILTLIVSPLIAQRQYGSIRGVVTEAGGEGIALPGVTVTIESQFGSRSVTTGDGGIFRFINLSTGDYVLKCELTGFNSYRQENLVVNVASSVDLQIKMELATLSEEITVVSESPMIDIKKTNISVNVTQQFLQEVPSARDPWFLLEQMPGTVTSAENVGGSASGMQYGLGDAKGAVSGSGIYNMDGVTITDGGGGSPAYYDFDSFEEVEISFAGNDASVQTGGTTVNFVTRRGSNKFEAGFHVYYTDRNLQTENLSSDLAELGYQGDSIYMIADYGVQLGGPIFKDKLWFWGGGGIQDIRKRTITDLPNEVQVNAMNFKLNAQIGNRTRAEFSWFYDEKAAYGRGASTYKAEESTYIQEGPARQFKVELERYFSDSFLMSIKGSAFPSWWSLSPIGGIEKQVAYDDVTRRYWDSYYYTKSGVNSYSARADGNLFVDGFLNFEHEFKFGIEWRYLPRSYTSTYGGDARKIFSEGVPYQARVYRERNGKYYNSRYSAYLQDNLSLGRVSVNLGLRFDREHSWIGQSQIRASKVAPELLPAITWDGVDPGKPTIWNTLSPRFGLTYDITGDRKTLLKMSLARYGVTMNDGFANHVSSVNIAYAQYYWDDLNGDRNVSQDELVGFPNDGLLEYSNFDPNNPTDLTSPNQFADETSSPRTDELIVGLERELMTDVSLRGTMFLRKNTNLLWSRPIGITKDNYLGPVQNTFTYDGQSYNYEYWYLDQKNPVGTQRENQPDYHENYSCLEFAVNKKFSNKWMANISFTLQKNVRHYGENGYTDPTNLEYLDGEIHPTTAGGVQMLGKATWFYELPFGILFSGFVKARQGKVYIPYLRVDAPEREAVGLGSRVDVYDAPMGDYRLNTFYQADIRFGKEFKLKGVGSIKLAVDLFNILNSDLILERETLINSTTWEYPAEILSPRCIRFSLRYQF